MPTNKRVYYAVQAVGLSKCGENSFTAIKGAQSVGLTTRFNLEQIFELGQVAIYELVENIPDVEATLEKVCDGYPPLYLQATNGSTSATLSGRQNTKCTLGLSIYSDLQDSASGTPLSQCTASGMYVSAIGWNLRNEGNFTESLTLVGNNKVWDNVFTATAFNNTDAPIAISGSGGVNRREDIIFGQVAGASRIPTEIPGVSSSGYIAYDTTLGEHAVHVNSIAPSCNLGREQLFELGKRGPYHRFATFPVEVRCDIEVTTSLGDKIEALEEAENITDQTIYLKLREGTEINLGSRNKLSSVTETGGDAGQGGGNVTVTYSYTNFNELTVRHPADPSTALRI